VKQRQDVNYIRNLIRSAIAESDEVKLRKSLELARCIGMDKDFMFVTGQQEFNSLKEFKKLRTEIRQAIYECNEKDLGEWLEEIRSDSSKMKSEISPVSILYRESLPYYEKMVYLRQFLEGKLLPMHRRTCEELEQSKQKYSPTDVKQCLLNEIGKEEALAMIIEEEKQAVLNAPPNGPLTEESELAMPTIRQMLDMKAVEALATLDSKYIQQIIDMFDMFGITDECAQFFQPDCYRQKAQLGLEDIQKSSQTKKSDLGSASVIDMVLQFRLKGTYYSIPDNCRDVCMKVYVDIFDKLGYHSCGPSSLVKLDQHLIDTQEEEQKAGLTPTKKKHMSYNYNFHQQDPVILQEDESYTPSPNRAAMLFEYDQDGVISVDMRQLDQFYSCQEMHYVITIEIIDPKEKADTRLEHESRIIGLKMLYKENIHYKYICDLKHVNTKTERCILCVISRLANSVEDAQKKPEINNDFELYESQQQITDVAKWEILSIGNPIKLESSFSKQISSFRNFLGILDPPKEMIVTIISGRGLASRDRNGKVC
jgi:hypothetical protein